MARKRTSVGAQPARADDRGGELVRFVRAGLAERADAEIARGMAEYMKTTQPFFGVMNTPRRELMREVWSRFAPANAAE
ncbi:MAG TPA: DNA alkylation repair protein, partial [Phycisphaerales bacterium]|nr:DNA alkylation repair protein [Phycisphaerales bacterium]